MALDSTVYETYCEILRQELIPAMGCTEPIAIAYAASLAGQQLGGMPERIHAGFSGNIIKNVKSVVVPGTGGARGIAAALAAGLVAGHPEKRLEVLSGLTEADAAQVRDLAKRCPVEIEPLDSGHIFDIQLTMTRGADEVRVRLVDAHTNVVLVEKNGVPVLARPVEAAAQEEQEDRKMLNVRDIVEFAETVDLNLLRPILERQLEMNLAIAEEGLRNPYGANIGKTLLAQSDDVRTRARAMAAAGSDARMNGCELPVCIVSGSGNQGLTASVPVAVYAKHLGASHEELLRALIVSDLVTVHQKTGIGRLSAYCGAISAGCGCGAGIAYLHGGRFREIAHTVVNAVAILSGTICDGAKSSCAAKIAMAVEAGILGYEMFRNGQEFRGGDGIVTKGVERTIENVGQLARIGMRETDKEIMRIMTEQN
ncbi:MAG: serine dehydratase subunit alpha family protein [Candidatus Avoscillospira sp.]